MTPGEPVSLTPADALYPARLRECLGANSPGQLSAFGNLDLLTQPKTALFSSARCPGDAFLRACDQAAQWRDAGRCVVSGFHSPVEKECLRILLRGSQPIIICPARSRETFRLPVEWKEPLAQNRLLLFSGFNATHRRATTALAERRNNLVAALADEAVIIHATPGGHVAQLSEQLSQWGVPVIRVVRA